MVAVSYSLGVSALVASSIVGQAVALPVQPISTSERAYPGGGPRTLLGRLVDYKVRPSSSSSLFLAFMENSSIRLFVFLL